MIGKLVMSSCHGTEHRGSTYEFAHSFLCILVCLLTFGVFKFIAYTGLVDVCNIGAKNLIDSGYFIHLILEFAITLMEAIEQTIGDTILHTVEWRRPWRTASGRPMCR